MVAVVVYHAFPLWLTGGFLGVDIFLVISGFLITRMIIEARRDGSFRLLDFYARRIRRIFPALIVVLMGCLALGWFVMLPDEYQRFGRHVLGAALFVSNFQFWSETGYFAKSAELTPLLHLWSLGVEEQFYLIWPCILILASKKKHTWLLATTMVLLCGSFSLQLILSIHNPDAAFYFPFARFWEFMVGAIVAITLTSPRIRDKLCFASLSGSIASIAGLALILVAIIGVENSDASPVAGRLLATIGAGLIILTGPKRLLSRLILAARPVVSIGRISYPLYLWHWPLLAFLRMTTLGEAPAWSRLAVLTLSIPLAWLTYVLVEQPIRFGRYHRYSTPALCAGLVVVGLLGLLDNAKAGFPSRFPVVIAKYLTSDYAWGQHARAGTCWLADNQAFDAYKPDCFGERRVDQRNVLIWGDSHAGRLYAGLSLVYGAELMIGQLTRDSCPPILNIASAICQKSNEYVLTLIAKNNPDVVVMFAVWNRYSADMLSGDWSRNLLMTLQRLKEIGVKAIVVIGPVPQWEGGLPRVLASYWRTKGALRTLPIFLKYGLLDLPFLVDHQMRELIPSSFAHYVSLQDMLCTDAGCRTRVSDRDGPDELITADYGHLTNEGAEYVARRLPIFDP